MSSICLGLQDTGADDAPILYAPLLTTAKRLTQVQFHWISRRVQEEWTGSECTFVDARARPARTTDGAAVYRVDARADAAFCARVTELAREFSERFRCAPLAGDGWVEWYTTVDKVDTESAKRTAAAAGWPRMRVALFSERSSAK